MERRLLLAMTLLTRQNLLSAQFLPDREKTLKTLVKINDYFMKKYTDFTRPSYVEKFGPSNIWARGIHCEGLMALHTVYPRSDYYDCAYDWVDFHKWGLCGGSIIRSADGHCCGQAYIGLYKISPDSMKIKDIKVSIDTLVDIPRMDDQAWTDAVQMRMPVLAQLGRLAGKQKYCDKIWQMYPRSRNEIGNGLFNQKEGLWWGDAGFVPPCKELNEKNCFWSRGNGWVYATLVRILNEVPENDMHRMGYMRNSLSVSRMLKACQHADGFQNVNLHDESNYGRKETSETSLFAYGVAWRVCNGLLDGKEYMPAIMRVWGAIVKEAVYSNGFLEFMQGSSKKPKDSRPVTCKNIPDFENYGIECFLLAGMEVYKMD